MRQAAHESGWQIVRHVLGQLGVPEGEALRLREGWLLGNLLDQIAHLLTTLETGQALPGVRARRSARRALLSGHPLKKAVATAVQN